MLQYNVEFFDRNLIYVYSCVIDGVPIEDDYISIKVTKIDIPATQEVSNGDFIRVQSDRVNFFGVVSDVSPGKYKTTIAFKPFISLFDEDFLFDTSTQSTTETQHPTLEQTLLYYIGSIYVNPDDEYQQLPVSIEIDPLVTQTQKWSFNITPETEGSHYRIMNLYSSLIVRALKEYGVAIDVIPDFSEKNISLVITKRLSAFKIDADLNDINVNAIKFNDRQEGINKLEVYNTENYAQCLTFYVHNDRTWDTEDTNRILPVARSVRSVAPSYYEEEADADEAFIDAAFDIAYSALSGLAWDNYIELEVYYSDPNVDPLSIDIGQLVTVIYKGARYTSILTGRVFSDETITLLFGSERIDFTKQRKLNGGY